MKDHTVGQGECLSSIAEDNGFFWDYLWEHPKNKELKEKRKDPNLLLPGDVVHIPDKRKKIESGATGTTHRFKVKGAPAKVNLRFLTVSGEPRAGLEYIAVVDGKESKGKTDGDGKVVLKIAPNARSGSIKLVDEDGDEESYDLNLGHLDPIDVTTGVQARLQSLGYYKGGVDGAESEELAAAIRLFQLDNGMEETGAIDDTLRGKVTEVYGA